MTKHGHEKIELLKHTWNWKGKALFEYKLTGFFCKKKKEKHHSSLTLKAIWTTILLNNREDTISVTDIIKVVIPQMISCIVMGYDSSDDAKWPWVQDIITMLEGKLMIIPALGHQNNETSTSEAWLTFVLMSQCRNNNELALLHGRFCTIWLFVAKGHRSQIIVLPIQKVS